MHALAWSEAPDWAGLELVNDAMDASLLARSYHDLPQPIMLANLVVSHDTEETLQRDVLFAKFVGIHASVLEPCPATRGKWQMLIECYCCGDRRKDYPDKRVKNLMG